MKSLVCEWLRRARPIVRMAATACGAILLGHCVPPNEVPSGGGIEAEIRGSDAVVAGVPVSTDDGWTITLERVYFGAPYVGLCFPESSYGSTCIGGAVSRPENATAVLDLARPVVVSQRNVQPRAFSDVQLSMPYVGSILVSSQLEPVGVATSGDDAGRFERMEVYAAPLSPTVDPAVVADMNAHDAVLLVEGTATGPRGTKRLELYLGGYYVDTATCHPAREVVVEQRTALNLSFVFHAEDLFLDRQPAADAGAPQRRFDAFAQADDMGNRDGIVTRDELEAVSLASIREAAGTYTLARPPNRSAGGHPVGTDGSAQALGADGAAQALGADGAAQVLGADGAAQALGADGAAQVLGADGAAQVLGADGAAQALGTDDMGDGEDEEDLGLARFVEERVASAWEMSGGVRCSSAGGY